MMQYESIIRSFLEPDLQRSESSADSFNTIQSTTSIVMCGGCTNVDRKATERSAKEAQMHV